jgi:putative acetyltransferase
MDAAARVHREAFDARLPHLAGLHTPDEDRSFFRDRVFTRCEAWGVFEADGLVGFIAFRPGWIDHLYVLPGSQGRGVGVALLSIAMERLPEINLWTFQANAGARGFYERFGFTAVEFTDGAGNEEREPDVRYFRAA